MACVQIAIAKDGAVNVLFVTVAPSERVIVHRLRPVEFPNWIMLVGHWRSADAIHAVLLELIRTYGPFPELQELSLDDMVLLSISIQTRLRIGGFEPTDITLHQMISELRNKQGLAGRLIQECEAGRGKERPAEN